MKGNNISSDHDQSQLTQAEQSITHLQHAINQAQSHPNNEIKGQIQQALERAERSLEQAMRTSDNQQAIDFAQRRLNQQKDAIQNIKYH